MSAPLTTDDVQAILAMPSVEDCMTLTAAWLRATVAWYRDGEAIINRPTGRVPLQADSVLRIAAMLDYASAELARLEPHDATDPSDPSTPEAGA